MRYIAIVCSSVLMYYIAPLIAPGYILLIYGIIFLVLSVSVMQKHKAGQ